MAAPKNLDELFASMDEEPMAVVRWNFKNAMGGVCEGSHTMTRRSDAQSLADKMNAEFGEGSHWVETLNHTKAERA